MQQYFARHITNIREIISADINDNTIDNVVQKFLKYHLTDKGSSSFQDYYFSILTNDNLYLASNTFFRDFKTRYSLQGIDNEYLSRLEANKRDILTRIKQDKLADMYFDYFAQAMIKHKDIRKPKDLGSFFAKLVHTFRPNDYCALDNPIKKHFGLQKESFFISFSIISSAYKQWTANYAETLKRLRQGFKDVDTDNLMQHDRITDLKLIDLVYWTKANTDDKKKEAKKAVTNKAYSK